MGCASNQSISKWVVLASSACSPLGGEASPPPVRARAGLVTGGIATHFERVDAAPCKQVMRVWDIGTRTLVTSRTGLRFVEPGQAWSDTRDASAGLPCGRGHTAPFSLWPLMVQVDLMPDFTDNGGPAQEYDRYLWEEDRWQKLWWNFGNLETVFPVHSGSLVIGWFDEKER